MKKNVRHVRVRYKTSERAYVSRDDTREGGILFNIVRSETEFFRSNKVYGEEERYSRYFFDRELSVGLKIGTRGT